MRLEAAARAATITRSAFVATILAPPATLLLGAASVREMRASLTMSYAAIWWLETSGLMPAGYYSNITTRTEYAD